MSSNFKVTLNQAEIAVPNTGTITASNNSSVGTISIGVVAILAVVTVVAAIVCMCSHRWHRFSYSNKKFGLNSRRKIITGLSVLAVMIGAFGVTFAYQNEETEITAAADSSLSVVVDDLAMSVVPDADGTFSTAAQTVKVSAATNAGYTLSVYANTADLVNSDNTDSLISGLSASSTTTTLGANTWGVATTAATDETSEVWRAMPSSSMNMLALKNTTSATSAGDETTVYYGVNVNTDLAYGDYTNTINYVVVANTSEASFDEAYAAAGKSKKDGYYAMQDGTASICTAVASGQVGQLIDSRDGNVYYVAKLADGNCWMLDNLRLDPTVPAVQAQLSSDTTNATNTILGYFMNGGGSSPYPANGVSNAWTSAAQDSYNLPFINATYKNTTTTSYGAGSGKVGVYYNYCAATAGSYCYDSTSGTGNASYDLCPANWRMPTGYDGNGDFAVLYSHYSNKSATSEDSLQYNLSTPLAGYFHGGTVSNKGYNTNFWSSSYGGSKSGILTLYVEPNDVITSINDGRKYGDVMRCLLHS